MKKSLLFAFAFISLSTLVNAQIEKGSVLLGGNLNFGSSKSEQITPPNSTNQNESKYIGITPSIGVAIKPNAILGIQFGHSQGENTWEPNTGSQEYQSNVIEVFLRRYFTLGKGFYLFAQPGIYYNKSTQEQTYSNSEQISKNRNIGISIYPGISYALNKRFHLEAGLGNMANIAYGQSKSEYKTASSSEISKSKGNSFSFSSSLSNNSTISIGFRFFLSKKEKA